MTLRILTCLNFIFIVIWNQAHGQIATRKEIDKLFNKGLELRFESIDSAYQIVLLSYKKSNDIQYTEGMHQASAFSMYYLTQRKDLDSAIKLSSYLLMEIDKANISDFTKGISYFYSGSLHKSLHEFGKAKELYFKALPLFEKLKELFFIGSINKELGEVEYLEGNYTDALDYFLKTDRFRDFLPKMTYASVLHSIGLCYSDLHHIDEAKDYLWRAIKINEKIGSKELARNFLSLAQLYSNVAEVDSACFYFNKSISISEKEDMQDVIFQSKLGIANVLAAKDLQSSTKILIDLMGNIPTNNKALNLAELYSALTSNSLNAGEYRKAIKYAVKIFDLELDQPFEYLQFASAKLDRAYEKLGIYDSALYYNKMRVRFTDSLNHIDERRKFTKLYAQIQNLEKEKEISELQNQKIVNMRNRSILIITCVAIFTLSVSIIMILRYRSKIEQKKMMIEAMKLQNAMESRERDFERQALNMANLNDRVGEFEEIIKSIKSKDARPSKDDLQILLNKVSLAKSMEIEWQKFEEYFKSIHKDFISAVSERHNALAPTELRLIALIKLGLAAREMASILNVEVKSINMYKYRLKKKFNLKPEEDLEVYLHMLENINENQNAALN